MLSRLLSLFSRSKKTIQPRAYVGPGIEVLSNGIPVTAVITDLTNYQGRSRESELNSRPAPDSNIVAYKWNWVTSPPKGVFLRFDDSAYTVLVVENTADLGTGKLQVVGTRADGTKEVSKEINIVVLRSTLTNEGA